MCLPTLISGVVRLALSYDIFLDPDMYTERILRPTQQQNPHIHHHIMGDNQPRRHQGMTLDYYYYYYYLHPPSSSSSFTIWIRVEETQYGDLELILEFLEEHTGGYIGLALTRDDDTGVTVVEPGE